MTIQPEIIVVAHNIRSLHNVGSIFRTAEGFGVTSIICSGYTPFPAIPNDSRLPHIREKLTREIHKTALGAETMLACETAEDPTQRLRELATDGYAIVALEQTDNSVLLPEYQPPQKLVLILGEEVAGVPPDLLALAETALEIPMHGRKESFNVSVAAGIALYHLRTKN